MAARITRAKKKISTARIPYRVPSPDQLGERVGAVLEVVHLIFTTGHTAPVGAHLSRRDRVDSAIGLARMLHLLIVGLYDVLLQLWPCSPVVELNRAVAIGMRDGPQAGPDALTPLLTNPALATYGYLSAARADFLRQLHRWAEAAHAYEEALTLTDNDVEGAEHAELGEDHGPRGVAVEALDLAVLQLE